MNQKKIIVKLKWIIMTVIEENIKKKHDLNKMKLLNICDSFTWTSLFSIKKRKKFYYNN